MTDTTAVPDLSRECLRRAGRASPPARGHRPRAGWHRLPGRRGLGGRPVCARAATGSRLGARIGGRIGAAMTTAARVAWTTLGRLPGAARHRTAERRAAPHGAGGHGVARRRRRTARRRACAASQRRGERVAALRALRPARSPASVVAALVLVGRGHGRGGRDVPGGGRAGPAPGGLRARDAVGAGHGLARPGRARHRGRGDRARRAARARGGPAGAVAAACRCAPATPTSSSGCPGRCSPRSSPGRWPG